MSDKSKNYRWSANKKLVVIYLAYRIIKDREAEKMRG